MARSTFENRGWLPEERDSVVITTIRSTSVIEAVARRVTMGSDTKLVPRSGDVGVEVVPKGGAYGEDVSNVDDIVLKALKLGKLVRIAEEDIEDSPINILEDKKTSWASSYARYLDNATLAVTGAIGTGVPFQSLYRSLSVANTATGYTAGANIVKTAAGVLPDHQDLSDALAKREGSMYYDPAKEVVLADVSFKAVLRNMRDTEGRLEFAPSPSVGQPDTIFGLPIKWSQSMKTSATATDKPTGNPILVFGNRDFLILGVRSGPESVVIDGRDGTSATTDETLLKMRARRAFNIGHEDAFVIVEAVKAA